MRWKKGKVTKAHPEKIIKLFRYQTVIFSWANSFWFQSKVLKLYLVQPGPGALLDPMMLLPRFRPETRKLKVCHIIIDNWKTYLRNCQRDTECIVVREIGRVAVQLNILKGVKDHVKPSVSIKWRKGEVSKVHPEEEKKVWVTFSSAYYFWFQSNDLNLYLAKPGLGVLLDPTWLHPMFRPETKKLIYVQLNHC